jgi:hypothetical protein
VEPNKSDVYYLSARYPSKQAAGRAYSPLEKIIREEECDLSVYRFFMPVQKKWYVAVVGFHPDEQLHQRIETILYQLTRGEKTELENVTLLWLLERRLEQTQHGDWVERHYNVPNQEGETNE